MPQLTQPATSTQPVQQVVNPPGGYDPTGDVVQMAFVPAPASGPPSMPPAGSPLWNAASWVTENGPVYWASCLVGPANGGIVLTQGAYVIAVRVADNPAVPELWGWNLQIT